MKTIFGLGVVLVLACITLNAFDEPAAAGVAGAFSGLFFFMAFGVWLWKVMDE